MSLRPRRAGADLASIRRLLALGPQPKKSLAVIVAASILRTVLSLPLPLIGLELFDDAIPSGDTGRIVAFGLLVVFLFIASSAVDVATRRYALEFCSKATMALRREVMECLTYATPDTRRRNDGTTLFDAAGTNVDRVENGLISLVVNMVPSGLLATAFAIQAVIIEWRLAAAAGLSAPLAIVASRWAGERTRTRASLFHRTWSRYNEFAHRSARLAPLIRASSLEPVEVDRHHQLAATLRSDQVDARMAAIVFTALMRVIVVSASSLAIVVGAVMLARDSLTVGSMVGFLAALSLMRTPAQQMIQGVPLLSQGLSALAIIDETLASTADERDHQDDRQQLDLAGCLIADGVTHEYVAGTPLFRPVSFICRPGETTVIAGPNGVGKSTLVSLLIGLRAPTEGSLCADGVPYDQLDLHHLRRQMAVLVQELMLDEGSVYDIIGYGLDDPDPQWLETAAHHAGADFVDSLPNGFRTVIGRRGIDLSLGQHQRLAIARALARRPRVLILDEPTNHLDPAAVQTVLQRTAQLPQRPTVIIVSHHEATMGWADQVVRLEPSR